MIRASNCTRNRRVRSRAAIAVFWSLVGIMLLTACEEELSPSNSTADSTTVISTPSELAATPTQADKVRASATASAVWIADNWSKSESVAYEELFRNIDLYEGKSFRFAGKVIQVLDADDDRYQMRISITRGRSSWSNPVFVHHTGVRILEDDIVQFVATVNGAITYETIFGGEITIPELTSDQLQVVDEDILTNRLSDNSDSARESPIQLTNDPDSDSAKTAPVDLPSPSTGPVTQFDDGIWRVGIDIKPGIYSNQGPDDCYWKRLSGFSGASSETIESAFLDGRAIVEILPTDVGFDSTRCGEWTPVGAVPTGPTSNFGDGIWRVGIDIKPGIYSNQGPDDCYWKRLSGFSGASSETIESAFLDGRAIVEILPTDVGFDSTRCGEWTPVGAVPTGPTSNFGDGIWRVGIDIKPGIYSNQGPDDCYWKRLSGFSGASSETIESAFLDGRAIVEILPTDIGFDSTRCGEWSLLNSTTP